MYWTAFQDVVVEIKPNANRMPASIDKPAIFKKQMESEVIIYDCKTKAKEIYTDFAYVRFTFNNCQQEPKLINSTNKFQASLWPKSNAWITDYIPLEENKNLFKIDENMGISVIRRLPNDAATSQ